MYFESKIVAYRFVFDKLNMRARTHIYMVWNAQQYEFRLSTMSRVDWHVNEVVYFVKWRLSLHTLKEKHCGGPTVYLILFLMIIDGWLWSIELLPCEWEMLADKSIRLHP